MKKIITFYLTLLFISIIGMGYVSAGNPNIPPVKQGESAFPKQTCGSCTYLNVSIYFPNGSIATNNVEMTNNGGGVWIYEFPNTTTLGRYDYPTCGDVQGVHTCTSEAPYFEVTPSGKSGTENIIFQLALLIILYSLTLLFFLKRDVDLAPFVVLSGMALGILGIYLINNGLIIYRDWFTNYLSYVTIGVGFGLSLWALISWIEDAMK